MAPGETTSLLGTALARVLADTTDYGIAEFLAAVEAALSQELENLCWARRSGEVTFFIFYVFVVFRQTLVTTS